MKSQSLLVYLYNIVLFILRESVCPLLRYGLQASSAGNQGNHRDILLGSTSSKSNSFILSMNF